MAPQPRGSEQAGPRGAESPKPKASSSLAAPGNSPRGKGAAGRGWRAAGRRRRAGERRCPPPLSRGAGGRALVAPERRRLPWDRCAHLAWRPLLPWDGSQLGGGGGEGLSLFRPPRVAQVGQSTPGQDHGPRSEGPGLAAPPPGAEGMWSGAHSILGTPEEEERTAKDRAGPRQGGGGLRTKRLLCPPLQNSPLPCLAGAVRGKLSRLKALLGRTPRAAPQARAGSPP